MFMNSQEPALIAIMYGNHAPDASILGFVNGFSRRFASPSAWCFASLLPPIAVTHSLHNLLLQVSQESNGLHQAADNFAFDILVEAVAYSQVRRGTCVGGLEGAEQSKVRGAEESCCCQARLSIANHTPCMLLKCTAASVLLSCQPSVATTTPSACFAVNVRRASMTLCMMTYMRGCGS